MVEHSLSCTELFLIFPLNGAQISEKAPIGARAGKGRAQQHGQGLKSKLEYGRTLSELFRVVPHVAIKVLQLKGKKH
jgi:hypothetical protein